MHAFSTISKESTIHVPSDGENGAQAVLKSRSAKNDVLFMGTSYCFGINRNKGNILIYSIPVDKDDAVLAVRVHTGSSVCLSFFDNDPHSMYNHLYRADNLVSHIIHDKN